MCFNRNHGCALVGVMAVHRTEPKASCGLITGMGE